MTEPEITPATDAMPTPEPPPLNEISPCTLILAGPPP